VNVPQLRADYERHHRAQSFSWNNCGQVWLALNYLWYRRSLEQA
jgi:hypothetical protein